METALLAVAVALCVLIVVLLLIFFNRMSGQAQAASKRFEERGQLVEAERRRELFNALNENQRNTVQSLSVQLIQIENRMKTLETGNEQKLENMRATIEQRLRHIQADNNERLEQMRNTVDEKLQKTLESKLTASFQLVSDRLEAVYKSLGEMKSLETGVSDLRKVLSNVKTRGTLGEIQLGAILEQILSCEQYEKNAAVNPNKNVVVEYAIKLPADENRCVYLPIDSKFPADVYVKLQDAYDSGSADAVAAAAKELIAALKKSAKDIREKYIEPPFTTDFAMMFLPTEGLYAEAVNRGMVEVLQNEYRVNIAGPSTMAATLNSLQMGFKTLAIQKRSSEVWELLGAVKTEFEKFHTVLHKTQERLRQADKELEVLVGTRTNVIMRRLRGVQSLEEGASRAILEKESAAMIDEAF